LFKDLVAAGVLGLWSVRALLFEKGEAAWLVELVSGAWPPGPHFFGNLLRSAGSILLAFLLLLLFDSAGMRLLRLLLGRRAQGAVRAGALFIGYAFASAFLLGVACAGIWHDPVLLFGLAGLAALGFPEIRSAAGDWAGGMYRLWNELGFPARAVLCCAAAVWLSLTLVPEIHIDCMQYHLALPQQLGVWHRIPGRGVYNGWVIPVASDLPNVFSMMFGLDSAATIVKPVMLMVGAYAFLKALEFEISSASWVILPLAVLSPDTRFILATAKNDAVVCGYVLVLCAFLLKSGTMWRRVVNDGLVFAAALLAGMVLASKYVLLPLVLALLLAALWGSPHARRGRVAFLMAAGALIPFLPWALKSFVFFADPLYPAGLLYFPGLFGDPSVNENTRLLYEALIRHDRLPSGVFMEVGWLSILNAPLLLVGVPALLERKRHGQGLLMAGLLVGLGGVFLMSRGAIDAAERYAYPVFVAWGLLGGAAYFSAAGPPWRHGVRSRVPAVLAVVLALACLLRLVFYQRILYTGMYPSEYHAGKVSAGEYRERGMYTYGTTLPVLVKAAEEGRAGRRLLLIGETLTYGLPLRAVMDSLEPPFVWKAVRESDSVRRIRVKFKQAGISVVVYNLPVAGWGRYISSPYAWDSEMLARYKEFVRRHYRVCWSSGYSMPFYGTDWIVSVSDIPLPPAKRIRFLPGAEAAYSYAAMAEAHGRLREAVARFTAVRKDLGDVSWSDSLLGNALVQAKEYARAYPLVKRSIAEGLLDETNLLDLAAAAGNLGKLEEMKEALVRADSFFPISPGKIGEALRKADLMETVDRAGFKLRHKWRPWWVL